MTTTEEAPPRVATLVLKHRVAAPVPKAVAEELGDTVRGFRPHDYVGRQLAIRPVRVVGATTRYRHLVAEIRVEDPGGTEYLGLRRLSYAHLIAQLAPLIGRGWVFGEFAASLRRHGPQFVPAAHANAKP